MQENQFKKRYAEQWKASAEEFYNNQSYQWMTEQISDYKVVLEVGCGCGHSTLTLVEYGHKVYALDKNEFCINKTKELIEQSGYRCCYLNDEVENADVILLPNDICEQIIVDVVDLHNIDVAICWNVGSYWSKEMRDYYYDKLIKYGLTHNQIQENEESSYSEYIQWKTIEVVNKHKIPVHLIDRYVYPVTPCNDTYYISLKDGFEYKNINYFNLRTNSISIGGRPLANGDNIINENQMELVLIGVLIY